MQFLLKLMRTALICKLSIYPSESSVLPCRMAACKLGLSLFQQALMNLSPLLISVVAVWNLLFACLFDCSFFLA